MNREITLTKDGSATLYVPELDEHYHSVHGALQESLHVFISAGFQFLAGHKTELHILEIGLGTGLNAWLSLLEAGKKRIKTHYTSIEKYPVTPQELEALKYDVLLNDEIQNFKKLHEASWNRWNQISPYFNFLKQQTDLKAFSANAQFDLIYFDAFAPSAQADLWTESIFENMYRSLKPGGVLVTYCVKGEVRRNMNTAGFEVAKIPGPPGKREMARARKPE